MLRLCLSVHVTINGIFKRSFQNRFLQYPAKVNLSTSYPFYFLCVAIDCLSQFEDVGSPIADEVMEEQADTKKTRTEMTDQEIKHASHTQYTMSARGEASMNATFGDVSLLDRSMYYWASTVQIPIADVL